MLDFWNSNIVATVVGAIVGGIIAVISSYITFRKMRQYENEKEQRERFNSKARLIMRDKFDVYEEQIKQKISVVLCSYKAKMKDGFVEIEYPKELLDVNNLKYEHFYFENVGKSDIYDFEFAVENPKCHAMFKRDLYTRFMKEGLISYGVSLDKMLRKGEIVRLTVYYSELDPIINIYNASLLVFYRDELNNVCEQAVFPEQNNIYEPTLIIYKDWREHVSVNKNLDNWKRRLSESKCSGRK